VCTKKAEHLFLRAEARQNARGTGSAYAVPGARHTKFSINTCTTAVNWRLVHSTLPWKGAGERRSLFIKYVPYGTHYQYTEYDMTLPGRVRSNCRFSNRDTLSVRKSGAKWMGCGTKRQCYRTLLPGLGKAELECMEYPEAWLNGPARHRCCGAWGHASLRSYGPI
jgi:hypothetical protein